MMLMEFCRMNQIMGYVGHISHFSIARHRRYSSVKMWFVDEAEPELRMRVFEELTAFMDSSIYRVGEFNGDRVTMKMGRRKSVQSKFQQQIATNHRRRRVLAALRRGSLLPRIKFCEELNRLLM